MSSPGLTSVPASVSTSVFSPSVGSLTSDPSVPTSVDAFVASAVAPIVGFDVTFAVGEAVALTVGVEVGEAVPLSFKSSSASPTLSSIIGSSVKLSRLGSFFFAMNFMADRSMYPGATK